MSISSRSGFNISRSRLLLLQHTRWLSSRYNRPAATFSTLSGVRITHDILSSCQTVRWLAQKPSFASPSRPDVFYHFLDPPNPLSQKQPSFALSFLQNPPADSGSRTIIGWLPVNVEGEAVIGSNGFVENPKFRDILHEAIQDGLRDGVDEIQTNGALQLQGGWMHIHDDRNIPPLGRIGDPDDIIATVLVRDSKIISDTYQAMPSYRLCTADGPIKLTPGLTQKLKTILEKYDNLGT